MPHAALWVVQHVTFEEDMIRRDTVSMPHAALWVVQPLKTGSDLSRKWSFNAARGFVGGAASHVHSSCGSSCRFNAARGFVGGAAKKGDILVADYGMFQCRTRLCGWCSLVALSSFPPRGKKHFWKVSGNSRVLTENM